MRPERRLHLVKLLHTVVWAVLGSCVLAIPMLAWRRQYAAAIGFSVVILVETAVLAVNRWQCPLTPIAGRYTTDRRPNFDIYLPEWLARYNKHIFGSIYVAGLVLLLARSRGWL